MFLLLLSPRLSSSLTCVEEILQQPTPLFAFALLLLLPTSPLNSYKMVSLMRRPDAEMAEGVGMWSTLMEAMGLLAILTNTAIICFTSGTLESR